MKINFSVKALGKKRPFLDKIRLDLPVHGNSSTLREFLQLLVAQQVEAFNQRKEDKSLISFLSEKQISTRMESGKVGFNESYNNQKADTEKAIENVLQAFEDGLIAFFLDDEQIEKLDEEIQLTESSHIAIIRLTFLAGSYF